MLENIPRLIAEAASAQVIPDNDEADGNGKDQSGDGIDFRGDAAAEAAPDFQRQSIVASNEEKGHGNFVHRERENEQAGCDERQLKIGQSDTPKRLPGSSAKVEGSFFLGAVQFLQAGKKFRSGNGNERRTVTKKNCN